MRRRHVQQMPTHPFVSPTRRRDWWPFWLVAGIVVVCVVVNGLLGP